MPRLLDTRFTKSLVDTPDEYDEAYGFVVTVREDGTALEFRDPKDIVGGGAGTVLARIAAISETTGLVNIGRTFIGTVLRVRALVLAPFSDDTTVDVGTQGEPTSIASFDDVDWTQVGAYDVTIVKDYDDVTQLIASITAPTGSSGSGLIIVELVVG